jgi:Virulence-associated protein E
MVLLLTRVNGVGIARHRLKNEKRREITSYYEKTGECFAVGSVARAFEPGCKVDCLPVLVGRQAWKKSGAIQALVLVPAWSCRVPAGWLISRLLLSVFPVGACVIPV